MAWKIRLEKNAQKELKKISQGDQLRIYGFLKNRLAVRDNPREIGDALSGPFKDYWKYHVGDYRLIALIEDEEIVITIVRIGNRREIYR